MTTQDITTIKPQVKLPRIPKPLFRVHTNNHGDRVVQDMDDGLLDVLRDVIRSDSLYEKPAQVSVDTLFSELGDLRNHLTQTRNRKLRQLVQFVETEHRDALAQVQEMQKSGLITFSALHLMFGVGTHVVVQGEHAQGGKVTECVYRETMWGRYLDLEVEYITSNGREFCTDVMEVHITGFTGVRPMDSLPVQLLQPHMKDQLHARGATYVKVALGAHYMHLNGHMLVQKWWNWNPMRAQGRCMVDIQTHEQFSERSGKRRRGAQVTHLAPDQWWMTNSHVLGFSFVTKQWGQFPVSGLQDIQFKQDAYDQLVLDPEKKHLIRALVQHSEGNFEDIISGKGGGCIFLLHGEPGVGKTLTAEAVSELLQRPLYSVSVGELGTDPATMEKNLRQILDVAQIWNAVILLDEADIFLEKRSTGDILRNACVGVLLRLLEYHQGVMFLTTNRVQEFDPAFYSRISVALRYDALSTETRIQIWRNLLDAAGLHHVQVVQLAQHELNGRQIKNIIRLSTSLAKDKHIPVSEELIESCVIMSQEFMHESTA